MPNQSASSIKKTVNIWCPCSFCGTKFKFATCTMKGEICLDIYVGIDGLQVALEPRPFKRSKVTTEQGCDVVAYRCESCRKDRREVTLHNQQIMQPCIYFEDITPDMIVENRKAYSHKLADAAVVGMRNDFYKS